MNLLLKGFFEMEQILSLKIIFIFFYRLLNLFSITLQHHLNPVTLSF